MVGIAGGRDARIGDEHRALHAEPSELPPDVGGRASGRT
jgi:hypothetical protein